MATASCAGYWDDPAATTASIDEARFMHTGDLATIDQEGYCNIVGRLKDMVIRGGENVYPREVEEFLFTHPAVAEVQAFGVPDRRYGEELCVWVRRREGSALNEAEIIAFCRASIAHYQGSALRALRRFVPDDGHRKGSKVFDAQGDDGGTGPGRRTDGLSLRRLGHPSDFEQAFTFTKPSGGRGAARGTSPHAAKKRQFRPSLEIETI